MCELMIFGGTTEGRRLAEFCNSNGIEAYVSVTSEYGEALLPHSPLVHIIEGKMNDREMEAFFREKKIRIVIDATHPHAKAITKTICSVCGRMGLKTYRVTRDIVPPLSDVMYFDTIDEIISFLEAGDDNSIFIATGSKELAAFCRLENFENRCVVRILDSPQVIARCRSLGFLKERILAFRGPFSREENESHFRKYHSQVLVTKDSGDTGGFLEKAEAARNCGMKILAVRMPMEQGISIEKLYGLLREEFGVR